MVPPLVTYGDGLQAVRLTHPGGASCLVALFGAHVVSYISAGGENLFLSRLSALDGSKPIRGGIPLCFPQFGPGPLPNHGFARTSLWSLSDNEEDGDEDCAASGVRATLLLRDSAATRAVWPHAFTLRYTVELTETSLRTTLRVANDGDEAFSFQALLHTYFAVPSIEALRVLGLRGTVFLDKLTGGRSVDEGAEEAEPGLVREVTAETDRIFYDAPDFLELVLSSERRFGITKGAALGGVPVSSDAVQWNPWVAKSRRMVDFGDEEYRSMVCIEPGFVKAGGLRLDSGQTATLWQELHPPGSSASL